MLLQLVVRVEGTFNILDSADEAEDLVLDHDESRY
jgi:hypothetical protein